MNALTFAIPRTEKSRRHAAHCMEKGRLHMYVYGGRDSTIACGASWGTSTDGKSVGRLERAKTSCNATYNALSIALC